MNAKKAAIRRRIEKEPKMGSKGRPQYGGAGLTRAGAERQFGKVLSKLAGIDHRRK